MMLASARKLASMGADFLICPDNTLHQALPHVIPRSPLPWLHIAEVVAAEAAARGYRCVGLTGTRWLMEGPVYAKELLRPTAGRWDDKGAKRAISQGLMPTATSAQ
jgi:aspartate racemase